MLRGNGYCSQPDLHLRLNTTQPEPPMESSIVVKVYPNSLAYGSDEMVPSVNTVSDVPRLLYVAMGKRVQDFGLDVYTEWGAIAHH